jgi:ketosteroid isomerase-like protein
MNTKALVEDYFKAIHEGGWESYIADDFTFVNLSLDRVTHTKEAYLDGAGKFFKTTTSVEIREMIDNGDKVAVIARYATRNPKGDVGVCDVAEFLTVSDNKLTSSSIFFDSKALFEFMTQE